MAPPKEDPVGAGDIIGNVGRQIRELERARIPEEREPDLLRVSAIACQTVEGEVVASATDPAGSDLLALATSQEVLLVDGKEHKVALRKRPLPAEEGVRCLAMSSSTAFRCKAKAAGSPWPKLVVAGDAGSGILVYDVVLEQHGPSLRPLCTVSCKAEEGAPQPAIQQLCCFGSTGVLWLIVLLSSGSCAVFLVPPGPPRQDATSAAAIAEEREGDDVEAESGEFAGCPVIATPLHHFNLAEAAGTSHLRLPRVQDILLSAFGLAPDRYGLSPPPLHLLVACTQSHVVQTYSFQLPDLVARNEKELEALQAEPFRKYELKDVPQPEEPKSAAPSRSWQLPSRTTVHAVANDGLAFAVGGVNGCVALFKTAPSPQLRTMLPGHYAPVSAMAFSSSLTLVTAGMDGYLHLYSVLRETVVFRSLLTPPPTTPPCVGLAAATLVPTALALDQNGNLRLLDAGQCCKLAALGEEGTTHVPDRVLATHSSYCVLARKRTPEPPAETVAEGGDIDDAAKETGDGATHENAPDEAHKVADAEAPVETALFFYDHDVLEAEEHSRSSVVTVMPETEEPTFLPEGHGAPNGNDAWEPVAMKQQSWQVSVKRYLRQERNEKVSRDAQMKRHMEQLQRELEKAEQLAN